MTRDGADTTTWSPTGPDSAMATSPPTNTFADTRLLFTRTADPLRQDDEACASFRDDHANVQEGIALRVRDGVSGTRALTVTKNIYLLAHWGFNVHGWWGGTAQPYVALGSADMSHVVGRTQQGGQIWSLCARARGRTVSIKLWRPVAGPEPLWSDPSVRHVTVPASEVAVGRSGWYIGHVPAGFHAWFSRLRVGPAAVAP